MLGYLEKELVDLKGYSTFKEISQQPTTWLKTVNQISNEKAKLEAFINQVVKAEDFDIIFTGAGTSEFVGNALYSSLNKKYSHKVKSYATTDIVADPELFISKDKPTLLISFGRSGSSPESVGAIEAADAVGNNVYHLFVTCNKNGSMANWADGANNCYALILTPETCDEGFAMTSSFTNMLLAAYLSLTLDQDNSDLVNQLVGSTTKLIDEGYVYFNKLVNDFNFGRIVYLGSNALKGIAQESALKMLELTAGEIVVMHDSPLGFRHGPKSIIEDTTLTVVYLSDNPYTRQYEFDLINEMSKQRKNNKILVLANKEDDKIKELVDYYYAFNNTDCLSNILFGLNCIVVAQIIACYKSLSLNITPDNPCPTGEVNRVVKGVTIYPYKKG